MFEFRISDEWGLCGSCEREGEYLVTAPNVFIMAHSMGMMDDATPEGEMVWLCKECLQELEPRPGMKIIRVRKLDIA